MDVDEEIRPIWQVTLNEGWPGQSLLHAYLAFHGTDDSHADTALEMLDRATDAASTLRLSDSLYFGFPGIGWLAAHLDGRLFEEEEDSGLEVDELLLSSLLRPPRKNGFDLLSGLVGLGVYALERLPRPSAARCLETIVTQLEERAEHTAEGAGFHSPPETLRPSQLYRYPRGTYNLGMAHGQAGVIALLGAVCHSGVATEKARPFLEAAVSWLLARELLPESPYRFSRRYTPGGDEVERGQLAWCHGDLGIATALLVAARGAGEPAWEGEARRIAAAAAAYSFDDAFIVDAELCHGAAGAGHLFNRLFQATGEVPFGEAAKFWLRQALAFRKPGCGVSGYQTLRGDRWVDAPGLREGAAGVGLCFLAAVSDVEPCWDRLLLASLRA